MRKTDYYFIGFLLFTGLFFMGKNLKSKFFSNQYDGHFSTWGKKLGVNPVHLKAVAATESGVGADTRFEPIGKTKGIMHVTIAVCREFYPNFTQDQFDKLIDNPALDIEIGSRYFQKKWQEFAGYPEKQRLEYAIKAYNGGAGRMRQIIAGKTSPEIAAAKGNMEKHWARYERNLEKIGVA